MSINKIYLSCNPMYDSQNTNQILGYLCNKKNIENFESVQAINEEEEANFRTSIQNEIKNNLRVIAHSQIKLNNAKYAIYNDGVNGAILTKEDRMRLENSIPSLIKSLIDSRLAILQPFKDGVSMAQENLNNAISQNPLPSSDTITDLTNKLSKASITLDEYNKAVIASEVASTEELRAKYIT